ncbi:MAG: response regulator [Magnetococcales bacterium]|nr:response regulator [Magnetococcales bacterium]
MARILIIDDDQAIRVLLRQILEGEGYEVLEAANGLAGLQVVHEEMLDLVVTDMLMPEGDGIEVILELQRLHPGVRVIAISAGGKGLSASFNLHVARDFGAFRTLAKPFSPAEVRTVVRRALEET